MERNLVGGDIERVQPLCEQLLDGKRLSRTMLKNHLADMSTKLHEHHPHKDFAKYDFFQILSIVYVLLSPRL